MIVPKAEQTQLPTNLPGNKLQAQNYLDAYRSSNLAVGLNIANNAMADIGTAVTHAELQKRREQAALHQKELNEINHYRVAEALNQYKSWQIDQLYGQDGALHKQGKAVFDQDGKPLSTAILDQAEEYQSSLLDTLGSAEQRMMFSEKAAELQLHLKQQLTSHENQQIGVYQKSVNQGIVATETDSITKNYNDPAGIQKSLAAIVGATHRSVQLEGLDDSIAATRAQKATSDALLAGINSALAQGDHASAVNILHDHSAHMDANDMLKAYSIITKEQNQRQAYTIGQHVMTEIVPKMQTGDADRAFNILLGAESGNRQFDDSGKPITSKKGAIGIAQVMPSTGPEAARFAGLPWDENKFRNDPEYNKALGQAYFHQQLQDFKGNIALAFAAYNAGPGAVKHALSQADKDGSNWLDHLPSETQDYVSKNVKAFNSGSGQFKKPTLNDAIALADQKLGENADPELRKKTYAEIEDRFKLQSDAEKQQSQDTVSQAYQQLVSNGGSWQDLPAQTRTDLALYAPDKIDTVMDFAKKIRKGDPIETDWNLYYQLHSDPFLLKQTNLMAFKDKLGDSEFKQLTSKQQQLNTGESTQTRNAKDILNGYMREAGIDPSPKDNDKSGAATVGKIWSIFDRLVGQAEDDKGKKLSTQEMEGIAAKLFTEVGTKGFLWGVNNKPAVLLSEADKIAVPDADRQQIIQAYRLNNPNRQPTESDIMNLYLKKKGLAGD